MSVMKRKMFNREARDELRRMGGIMASSAPLMEAAMGGRVGYQEGGVVENYAVIIPGMAPIRLNANTLSRLQSSNPELMQSATVLDTATAASQGIDVGSLRPGDIFIERQLTESSQPAPAPEPSVPFGQQVGDTMRGILQPVGEEIRRGLASSYSNNPLNNIPAISLATPDEENPMLQMIEPAAGALRDVGTNMPPVTPMYDMTQFSPARVRDPEMTGLEEVEQRTIETDPGAELRARVAEQAAAGKRAGEIADMLGRPILEVLDIGAGLASAGLLEGTAFAADLMSAFQAGLMGNQQAGEFYGGLATGIKNLSDEMYYNEGQFLPRVTAGMESAPTEEEVAAQRRAAIESESLRNISDALVEDPYGALFAEGSVSEALPDIPMEIIQARRTAAPDVALGAGDALRGASDLDYGQGIASILPGADAAVNRRGPGGLPGVDVSTGVPMSADEVAAAALALREEEGPLTMGQTEDRFPAEDILRAEQDTALAETLYPGRARGFREQEAQIAEMTGNVFPETVSEELMSTLRNLTPRSPVSTAKAVAAGDVDPETAETPKVEPAKPTAPVVTPETANTVVETITGDADPDASTVLTTTKNKDVADMVNDIGTVTDEESAQGYIDKYVQKFQKYFGEDEDQAAKDKGFAMAIFGATFASTGDFGQATAAMVDVLRGDEATRKAREDKIKMLAIEAGLAQETADLKYKRDLAIAGTKGTSDRSEYLYKSTFDNTYKDYLLTNPGDYEGALDAAQKAAAQAAPTAPSARTSGVDIPADTEVTTQPKTPAELNAEAKAAGLTEFVYNGMRYPVQ